MEHMEIRCVEGQHKSISARNWARIPKLTLPIFNSRDLTPIQSAFDADTTRISGQDALDQLITGAPQ